ncbi:MAG: organomercurial lyase [Solirubrobacterales bacterium]
MAATSHSSAGVPVNPSSVRYSRHLRPKSSRTSAPGSTSRPSTRTVGDPRKRNRCASSSLSTPCSTFGVRGLSRRNRTSAGRAGGARADRGGGRRASEDVEVALAAKTSAERDDQGRRVGLALTLRPTPHRFTGGCSRGARPTPSCSRRDRPPSRGRVNLPQTGQPIRVEVGPDGVQRVDPPTAVVSAVRPTDELIDLRADTCAHGHFFSLTGATTSWSEAQPDGHVLPVADAFRFDREVIERLGWEATGREAR